MLWAILALVVVPLWLCVLGIGVLLLRGRRFRHRPGTIPVLILLPGSTRWRRGHGVWIADVFAWRGGPAAWHEELLHVVHAETRSATEEERRQLRSIGAKAVVTDMITAGGTVRATTSARHAPVLRGPFLALELSISRASD